MSNLKFVFVCALLFALIRVSVKNAKVLGDVRTFLNKLNEIDAEVEEDEEEIFEDEDFFYRWGDKFMDYAGRWKNLPDSCPEGYALTPDQYVEMHQRDPSEVQ